MPLLTQPASPSPRRRPWLWVGLGVPGAVFLLLVGLATTSWDRPFVFKTEKHEYRLRLMNGCQPRIQWNYDYLQRDMELPGIPRSWFYFHLSWN